MKASNVLIVNPLPPSTELARHLALSGINLTFLEISSNSPSLVSENDLNNEEFLINYL